MPFHQYTRAQLSGVILKGKLVAAAEPEAFGSTNIALRTGGCHKLLAIRYGKFHNEATGADVVRPIGYLQLSDTTATRAFFDSLYRLCLGHPLSKDQALRSIEAHAGYTMVNA